MISIHKIVFHFTSSNGSKRQFVVVLNELDSGIRIVTDDIDEAHRFLRPFVAYYLGTKSLESGYTYSHTVGIEWCGRSPRIYHAKVVKLAAL